MIKPIDPTGSSSDSNFEKDAFLLVQESQQEGVVHRLPFRQIATIGRSSTNKISIKDDMCSRNHCEIFYQERGWTLRDLSSRNGTFIEDKRVYSDHRLEDGESICIGQCTIRFSLEPPSTQFFGVADKSLETADTQTESPVYQSQETQDSGMSAKILQTQKENPYREGSTESRSLSSKILVQLYQLVLKMSEAESIPELTECILEGILEPTGADIGAILLCPPLLTSESDTCNPEYLKVYAYKATSDQQEYQKVSNSLSLLVMKNKEAVLAKDVASDSRLSAQDSMAELRIQSLICTPIGTEKTIYGLIHLYSTNIAQPLDSDALDYAVAISEQFGTLIEKIVRRDALRDGIDKIKSENQEVRRMLGIESEIVGTSPPIQKLSKTISRIAATEATVLVRGDSGAGKELVARAIHFNSPRLKGPYVCMNCAALSESLLESELFGHEKGAFTGATGRKIGKFEQADEGTLFLDEVGEMSPVIQAKFLRVLEGHPFERVGGNTPILTDVRIVAATNRDLETAVLRGDFRKDLYFRLNVMEIVVPSLRERRSDIPILANHFIELFATKSGRIAKPISEEAVGILKEYDWPGNVRELKNVIERAFILSEEEVILPTELKFSTLQEETAQGISSGGASTGFEEKTLEDLEKEHILKTLKHEGWNKSRTAQILGIERSTLDRKLKRYGVNRPS